MSYLSAITWFQKTFTTRQRTTELLRPELDDKVISQHDYELATRFLPGPSMDWQLVYGAGTSAAVYGYGSYLSRPKWNLWRLRLGPIAAFLVGSTYGAWRQFLLHYRFANSLDNPQGFILALNHVDERLGGSGQIGFSFKEILANKPEVRDFDPAGHPRDTGMAHDGWVQDQDNTDGDTSRSNSTQLRTKWDEIRAANTRSAAQSSSWDIIRQRHERSKLPDRVGPPSDSPQPIETDERAAAQAKFDALLESERRRGHSSNEE